MIHGCCRRMLVGWCLFWLSASGWAVAQPAPVAPPAETLSHRLLEKAQHDIALVKPWLDRYGYGAVFVAVGVEGFGIPAPGETVLVAGALDATSPTGLNIGGLLLTAFLAAVLGSSLGYWIGHQGGRALLQRFRVDERHLQKIEHGFARYGGGLIVIARFFDGLRQLSGIAAGILKMPWWTFTLFNVLGAVLWVGCWGLGVYYLDEHLHAILGVVRQLNPWVAVMTLAGLALLLVYGWYRWRRQNRIRSDELLFCCARTTVDEETANRIQLLIDQGVSWNYLIRNAVYHRVASLLYLNTRQFFFSNSVQKKYLYKLQSIYKSITKRNLFLVLKMVKIINLLETKQIPIIPYKGPVLAFQAYKNIALRCFVDLDIRVHSDNYVETRNILFEHGYRLMSDFGWECSLIDDEHEVSIDLHQEFFPEILNTCPDFQSLYQRLEVLPILSGEIKTLCPEDMLLILCIQLIKDGLESNPLRLIKVCDIAELLRAHPDLNWEQIFNEARKLGCQQMLVVSLSVVHELLGVSLPDVSFPELPLKLVTSPDLHDLTACIRYKIIHKIGYRRFNCTLVPNERDRAFLSLPKSFDFLYYVIRPIRLIRNYGRSALMVLMEKYSTWRRQR